MGLGRAKGDLREKDPLIIEYFRMWKDILVKISTIEEAC